ncbi:ATPase WRNIP1-like [Anopheles gambiae]|uniref:ATPase WRNIP1-like n=1 Tax=Anopheles gambiae TaxID=7165 RepID=UPI002AC8E774|nr:ATPase WRNIP1-like [Anopheles gambiae]
MASSSEFDDPQPSTSTRKAVCPICDKWFPIADIEQHVDECLTMTHGNDGSPDEQQQQQPASNTPTSSQGPKRNFSIFERSPKPAKRGRNESAPSAPTVTSSAKVEQPIEITSLDTDDEEEPAASDSQNKKPKMMDPAPAARPAPSCPNATPESNVPLAERVRPSTIEEYVGQEQIIGQNTILRKLFEHDTIPSMILWGPPGCGKTTLANIIANRCKRNVGTLRFAKLSATMAGVAEVKEVVKVAKNESKFNRRTILFMDEIHRFNKQQQDIFLPHVESGTITLIGATTENPSFSLNSALLSRCRVIVLEKHTVDSMMRIMERALPEYKAVMVPASLNNNVPDLSKTSYVPRMLVHEETIRWLAETCDGDARIGLNSLQLALSSAAAPPPATNGRSFTDSLITVTLEDVREGLKKSHLLYDRKGDQHYDIISALHKSIRASDDNAALYWATRMVASGEDPRYICRRMVRMASEDIGLADANALQVATATLSAVQSVGLPEADCIIAQCAVYLARAPKSREVYEAYKRCRASIDGWKGPMPGVPLHLRNAPTKLMKDLRYGAGYNLLHKDESGLTYMPEGLEDENYFSE